MSVNRVGVTGHRRLLEKEAFVFETTKSLLERILDKRPSIEVNTGMALGFDQLVCEVCLVLGIPYVAVIPCDAQEALWTPSQQARYARLVAQAIRSVQVSPGPYAAWKMHARNGWIVKNSEEMVVHWDGFYQGGTGGCMKLVKSAKLPWVNTFVRG